MPYKEVEKRRAYQKQYRDTHKEAVRHLHKRWYRDQSSEYHMLTAAKRRAKIKHLEFNLDVSDIVIPKRCPILDIELVRSTVNVPRDHSPSLDRIDNSKGYVKGNIQVISNKANVMKAHATIHELRKFARWVDQLKLS